MDDFLSDIYVDVLKKWILLKKDYYHFHYNENDNVIEFQIRNCCGEISFHLMNIIEFHVYDKRNHDSIFYLHFQMKTINHALTLFMEMMNCIEDYNHIPMMKVLLCCSGGYTTSYFALKIQEAASLLNINMEVKAVGYNRLFHEAQDYDVILLAPQIYYVYSKVKAILNKKVVLKIPTNIFASYDVGKMISLLLKEKKNDSKKEKNKPLLLKRSLKYQMMILCLSLYQNKDKYYMAYRLYDHQKILVDREIIKPSFCLDDIYDVFDTLFITYPTIDRVNVSVNTIVNDGNIQKDFILGLMSQDFKTVLKNKYDKDFYITNDANNAVIGYYASQTKYSSCVFLFQPTNSIGGSGIIINGSLILENHGIAGEMKYLPLDLSDSQNKLSMSIEGNIELLSKTILSYIALINPDVIVIYSDLLLDVNDLYLELKKSIDEDYIPQLIKIDDLKEYILFGQMIYCSQV